MKTVSLSFSQHWSQGEVIGITYKLKWKRLIWRDEDWCTCELFVEKLERTLALIGDHEWSIFLKDTVQGCCDLGEILDESAIEFRMALLTANTFDRRREWKISYRLELFLVHFNPFSRKCMAEYDPLMDHEMALLPT